MFFSIIIPVYNVENYLEHCLNSVLHQDFDDFEIILVDDGSTDNSGKICDEYSEKHSNIRVIHKENGGLDSARKIAINLCSGKYVLFLDSDDWIADGCLSKIEKAISKVPQNVDVIQTAYYVVMEDGSKSRVDSFEKIFGKKLVIEGIQFAENVYKNKISMGNACSKIYRTDFLKRASLPVAPQYSCEDVEMLIDCALIHANYSYIDEDIIMFRSKRQGSITTTIHPAYVMGYLDTMVRLVRRVEQERLDANRLCVYFANMFVDEFYFVRLLSNDDRNKASCLMKHSNILGYADEKRWRVLLYQLLGGKMGNVIIRKVYQCINLFSRIGKKSIKRGRNSSADGTAI